MDIFKTEDKQNFLDALEMIRHMIPVMDMDDRDFVASFLYRMAQIVREHGPSHGVTAPESVLTVTRNGFRIGEFELKETPGGFRLVKWADSADRLPERKLEDLISKVIVDPPATVIYWKDGTKTVVKCSDEDLDAGRMTPEAGIVYAIAKKVLGNKGNYNDVLRRLVKGAKKS